MVKDSPRTNGFAPINPLKLSGLHQAEYVLNCMIEGQSRETTINKFEGDEQLVQMWILFVVHNHWIEKNKVGALALTEKGRRHLEEYKSASSFRP